jgi:ribosomal protein S18 acetylase RimI-like enzyme
MISYKKCTEVEFEKVYKGFNIGFSDYIIKLELPQEDFLKRFFGPEGNSLEYSHIALDGEEPVGVILGGIKEYEGVKTIRCGALCIHPDYRGKGVSQELFELHKQIALDNKCKQMFLEVIVGNDRAIRFYNKLGYEKIYDISYYSTDISKLRLEDAADIEVKQIDFQVISEITNAVADVHINWQNDFDYMSKLVGLSYYGAYRNGALVGAISISPSGKIFFVWTAPRMRNNGIAKALLVRGINDLDLKRAAISITNNAKLEGFVKHLGFEKDKISQYEMYKFI